MGIMSVDLGAVIQEGKSGKGLEQERLKARRKLNELMETVATNYSK